MEGIAHGFSLMLSIIKTSRSDLALCQVLRMVSGKHDTSHVELGRISITDYIDSTGIISGLWVWRLSGFELMLFISTCGAEKKKSSWHPSLEPRESFIKQKYQQLAVIDSNLTFFCCFFFIYLTHQKIFLSKVSDRF